MNDNETREQERSLNREKRTVELDAKAEGSGLTRMQGEDNNALALRILAKQLVLTA
jgi:hypothetical protein